MRAKQELRIPQILDLQTQGYTNQQIAEALGVSRTIIWGDQKTDLYQYFLANWLTTYETTLEEMMKSDIPHQKLEGLKEAGRMIRGLKPKEIRQQIDKAEVKIVIHDLMPTQN